MRNTLTAKELLIDAKALISNPNNWTKSQYARTKENHSADVGDPKACKFCTIGALTKVNGEKRPYDCYQKKNKTPVRTAYLALFDAVRALKDPMRDSILNFNDSSSHQQVMDLFDLAIEACGEGS